MTIADWKRDYQAMARNLIRKGQLESPLMIFNRTKSRAEALKAEQNNCTIAESAEELVKKCDIIFTSLTDDDAVGQLYGSIMTNMNVQGKLFVDCSTVTPPCANTIGDMAYTCGADLVTMPGE